MARNRPTIRLQTGIARFLTGGQRGYQPRPVRNTSKPGPKGGGAKTVAGGALRQPPNQGSSAKKP